MAKKLKTTTRYVIERDGKFFQAKNPKHKTWGKLRYALMFLSAAQARDHWAWWRSISPLVQDMPVPSVRKAHIRVEMDEEPTDV